MGATRWGNRVATEKRDVQNLLIDTCKLLISEYRVDGFRFDATHTDYMDHGFLLRLAVELKAFKPSVLLVCTKTCPAGAISTAPVSMASPRGATRSTTR